MDLPKIGSGKGGHDVRIVDSKPKLTDPWFSGTDETCDTFYGLIQQIHLAEDTCCTKHTECPAEGGFPKQCSPACALAFHSMYQKCALMLNGVLPAAQMHAYSHFDGRKFAMVASLPICPLSGHMMHSSSACV